MHKPIILAIAATLLVSFTSAPVVAQEITILGAGAGWKLQSQRGPDGQNVYSYNCGPDFRRISHRRVSRTAWRTHTAGR